MNELVRKNLYLMHMDSDELYHYGILGMKWGVRRYQPYTRGYQGETQGRVTGEAKAQSSNRRKKILIGAGIAAGATALTIGAIMGAKHIRKLKKAKQYLQNFDASKVTYSSIIGTKAKSFGGEQYAFRTTQGYAPSKSGFETRTIVGDRLRAKRAMTPAAPSLENVELSYKRRPTLKREARKSSIIRQARPKTKKTVDTFASKKSTMMPEAPSFRSEDVTFSRKRKNRPIPKRTVNKSSIIRQARPKAKKNGYSTNYDWRTMSTGFM